MRDLPKTVVTDPLREREERFRLAFAEVLAGRRYLSPPLSDKAIAAYIKRAETGEVDIYETLTTREREVLHLAAEGLSNPAIGDRLGISFRTAESHCAHVMRKRGLKGKADLITYALNRNLHPGSTLQKGGDQKG